MRSLVVKDIDKRLSIGDKSLIPEIATLTFDGGAFKVSGSEFEIEKIAQLNKSKIIEYNN